MAQLPEESAVSTCSWKGFQSQGKELVQRRVFVEQRV